jgi:hypothetical protein
MDNYSPCVGARLTPGQRGQPAWTVWPTRRRLGSGTGHCEKWLSRWRHHLLPITSVPMTACLYFYEFPLSGAMQKQCNCGAEPVQLRRAGHRPSSLSELVSLSRLTAYVRPYVQTRARVRRDKLVRQSIVVTFRSNGVWHSDSRRRRERDAITR